jgi:hypothetical protein
MRASRSRAAVRSAAVAALGGLDVLPGDQRQQRDRGRALLIQLPPGQRGDQRVRIVHQG